MLHVLFSVYLKMLVLYSPFFVLSCFISLTRGYSSKERRRLAWKVALATLVSSVMLYLFGRVIFSVFGITVDAFRIGAGSVLFISALGMAQGKSAVQTDNVQQDVTIVPLTIPLTVGPGTIGALLVMGVSQPQPAALGRQARRHRQYRPGEFYRWCGAVPVEPYRTDPRRPGLADRQSPDGIVRLRPGGADHLHRGARLPGAPVAGAPIRRPASRHTSAACRPTRRPRRGETRRWSRNRR